MHLNLENKRALVTGSSRGIGAAIARLLAQEGVSVVVHGRDRGRTEQVANSIRSAGGQAAAVVGRLDNDVEVEEVVSASVVAFGGIDILVNNAGVFYPRGWWDTSSQDWLEIYNQNVVGSVRLIQALAPAMRARKWGRIIQVSSGLALLPQANMADYAATKLVNILTSVSLSQELSGTGVTVNTVSPGPISTPGAAQLADKLEKEHGIAAREEMESSISSHLTVQRPGEPEEVASAVVFLASERASYINGVNLRVDGGFVKAF